MSTPDPMRPIRRKVCTDIQHALSEGILELITNGECKVSPLLYVLRGMLHTILTFEGLFDLNEKLDNTQKAYQLLMDHWDHIPESERPELDRQLKELNL